MSLKIQEPYHPKAKILTWTEFNIADIDQFLMIFQSNMANEIYPYLEKMLDLNSSYLKPKILLDLHYYALRFAINNKLSKIQISTFLSILRAIHKANEETPFENYDIIIKYFNQLIICHSIQRPPFCVEIFDNQTAVKVINYITDTYLRHYKLYKYVFTPIIGLELHCGEKTAEYEDSELDNDSDLKTDSNSELRAKTAMSICTSIKIQESNQSEEVETNSEFKNYLKEVILDYIKSDQVIKQMDILEEERAAIFSQKVNDELAKTAKKK